MPLGYRRGLNTTDSRTYSKNTTFAKAREFTRGAPPKVVFYSRGSVEERGTPASSNEIWVDFAVGLLHTEQRNDDATG